MAGHCGSSAGATILRWSCTQVCDEALHLQTLHMTAANVKHLGKLCLVLPTH